jgi:uncharacterized membrane protein YraQ (UPF0718 family)
MKTLVQTMQVAAASAEIPESATARTAGKRLEIVLGVVLAFAIALIFWTQQRYPALEKKLHAGSSVQVKGAISFDALLKVSPEEPLYERVGRTSVNWLYTNRFGMYFALPFGAAVMTLMALTAKPKRFRLAASNVLCGAVAGAPMGVCTNCATPIGQSLLAGGASARMTVAAMISSPSFNPIVVAMVFVLFPTPLAVLRIAVPALLLVVLPLLVAETQAPLKFMAMPELRPNFAERLLAFVRSYGVNLLRLTWMTLPWMLLAAVLGAFAAETIPAYGTHLHASVWGIALVAIFGTLLPVPMALDVALAFVLYKAGAPAPYVAALLCTLGPVSVYSLSALAKQLGRNSALRLAGATAVLGTIAGLIVMVRS